MTATGDPVTARTTRTSKPKQEQSAWSRYALYAASPKIFYFFLYYLTAVLVVGTITQADFGIYQAQERYFSSWVINPMDQKWLPIPGGRLVLMLMSINLTAKLVFSSKWIIRSMGVNIAHLGTLLLMIGSLITAYFSTEGSLLIPEGGSRQYYVDDFALTFSVIDTNGDEIDKVYPFSEKKMKPGSVLTHAELPGQIKVVDYYKNAELILEENKSPGQWRGFAKRHLIQPKPGEKELRENNPIAVVEVTGFGAQADGMYFVTQSSQDSMLTTQIRGEKGVYKMLIGSRVHMLPNEMRFELNDFVAEYYPGTDKPRHFASHLTIYENGTMRKALIQMNEPLRVHGHTFYQSSFQSQNGQQATVLSVVKNYGRMFPYISSIVICIGIGLHLLLHYPAFLKPLADAVLQSNRVLLLLCTLSLGLFAEEGYQAEETAPPITAEACLDIIIHDGDRLKPLDTFARNTLIGLHQKQTIQKVSAIDWLTMVLVDPEKAGSSEAFTIRSPAVVEAIGVKSDPKNRYTLDELKPGFLEHEALLRALGARASENVDLLDPTERQLLQYYRTTSMFLPLVHSLSCFWPDIKINDPALAKQFGLQSGDVRSYFFFIATHRDTLRDVLVQSSKAKKDDSNYNDAAVASLWRKIEDRLSRQSAASLAIIPPANGKFDEPWRSPWEVLDEDGLSEKDFAMMQPLDQAVAAYIQQDQEAFSSAIGAFKEAVGSHRNIGLEVSYNKADLFYRSLYVYILGFICLMVFWLAKHRFWYKSAFTMLCIGCVMHFTGLLLRIIIMERPPVSTLYESIVMAGWIAVAFGVAVELWRKDTAALFSALLIAIVLQFVGLSYAKDGDTMGMLIAVLNSTFWLSTHVLTIIVGYGIALIAGILGHILLFRYIWYPDTKEKNAQLFKTARAAALVALFFTTLGTILGGIWADQSWGRFWGWDPKENGAMLIVLWLLISIHGLIARELNQIAFAAMLSLTNICVALAWFGVNLLNVGMHSYGFDDKTTVALFTFCGFEFILVVVAALVATWVRNGRKADKTIPSEA